MNFWALCGPFFIVPAAFKLWASLCMVLHAPLPWNYEKYDHLNLYFTCKARRIGHFSSHYYLLCRILIVLPSPPTVMLRTHPPVFILVYPFLSTAINPEKNYHLLHSSFFHSPKLGVVVFIIFLRAAPPHHHWRRRQEWSNKKPRKMTLPWSESTEEDTTPTIKEDIVANEADKREAEPFGTLFGIIRYITLATISLRCGKLQTSCGSSDGDSSVYSKFTIVILPINIILAVYMAADVLI